MSFEDPQEGVEGQLSFTAKYVSFNSWCLMFLALIHVRTISSSLAAICNTNNIHPENYVFPGYAIGNPAFGAVGHGFDGYNPMDRSLSFFDQNFPTVYHHTHAPPNRDGISGTRTRWIHRSDAAELENLQNPCTVTNSLFHNHRLLTFPHHGVNNGGQRTTIWWSPTFRRTLCRCNFQKANRDDLQCDL